MNPKIKIAIEGIKELSNFIYEVRKVLESVKSNTPTPNEAESISLREYSVSLLSKEQLLAIVKENIVPGANQSCVMKRTNDTHLIIYVTYAKDQNLLPTTENKYIRITCQAISRNLDSMFNQQELITIN